MLLTSEIEDDFMFREGGSVTGLPNRCLVSTEFGASELRCPWVLRVQRLGTRSSAV